MPLSLDILIGKILLYASRLLGRGGGSALPGLVAERLDPEVLAKFADRLPEGVVLITGTNGKTTATKMLAAILHDAGQKVVTNKSGSNLTRGIVSSLIEQSKLDGRLPARLGLFEVDEATMPEACRLLKPKLIIVLNLFRDQLDRYGELDKTGSLIGRGIKQTSAEVWLNADDPLVASLAQYSDTANVHYFGVENSNVTKLADDRAADSDHCPLDGRALEYSQAFFSHIGHYSCPMGDFERPKPELSLNNGQIAGHSLEVALPGLYNAYNALAAAAAATSLGISVKTAVAALGGVTAAFGRLEKLDYRGRTLYLLLIKNPTGFNQVIQTFLAATPANLMIAINDNFADGRDVSWLWDVGFEEIKAKGAVIASGIRADDLAVRLKYAEMKSVTQSDLLAAVEKLVEATPKGGTAYILPTYTAMLQLRNALKLERFEA